jgi:hypothetical protein
MTRRPKDEGKLRPLTSRMRVASEQAEVAAAEEIDRIIARLDAEIPKAQQSMNELLGRLRTTRIAA